MRPFIPSPPPTTVGQLVTALDAHLKERVLGPHQPFLSQYDIEKRFSVSIHLAKQALEHMERDGVLYRVHRKGTFVAPRARNRPVVVTAHEGVESPYHPVIAHTARLQFMQGVIDDLEADGSPHFATFLGAAKFREIRYDLPHVYRNVAGMVVFRDIELLEAARPVCDEIGLPLAFFGSSLHRDRLTGVHRLLCDEARITHLALSHLLEGGRRRISCAYNPDSPIHRHRRDLFLGWMDDHSLASGTDLPRVKLPNSFASTDRVWPRLATDLATTDAIYAVDDNVAVEILNEAVKIGIRVPDDVALVGVNNYPTSFHAIVPITTVDIPLRASGELLMNRLSARIDQGGNPIDLDCDISLIPRESTGTVRGLETT